MESFIQGNDVWTVDLLAAAGRAATRGLAAYLAATGLRPIHMAAMTALRASSRGQRELSEHLGLHATKAVTLLNDLEAAGLALRRRDPQDRRRHSVSLSELGRARLAAIDVAREKIEAVAFRDLSSAEIETLHALLGRVAGNLRAR